MNILYITYLLNGLLMLALPIGLGVYLTRRFGWGWRLWWIGAGTFVFSQVGHIPFNAGLTALFQNNILPPPPDAWKLPFNAVVLGLSAGLWEEIARYATYRWWVKDARTWRKGVLLGAGHGGIEAIILGLLVLLAYVNMSIAAQMDLTGLVPADQLALAQQQVSAYWSAPWYATLLGALERAFTLPFHIAASLLVLQAFTRKQIRWLWLAVGWHALVDAGAVYVVGMWGVYAAEVWVAVSALANLALIYRLYRPEPPEPIGGLRPLPDLQTLPPLAEPEESTENLDETRYN